MNTIGKIVFNAVLFIGTGVAVAIYKGMPFDTRWLGILILLAIPMGAFLWLRWDWAPKEGRRRRAERKRKAETIGK